MSHQDNGSFGTGVLMTALVIASACGGYYVRDIGLTVKIQQTTQQTEKGK